MGWLDALDAQSSNISKFSWHEEESPTVTTALMWALKEATKETNTDQGRSKGTCSLVSCWSICHFQACMDCFVIIHKIPYSRNDILWILSKSKLISYIIILQSLQNIYLQTTNELLNLINQFWSIPVTHNINK